VPISLLVVDDEPNVRELLRRMLEFEGFEVTIAADVGSALEALERKRPAAVLCDVHMPGDRDGLWLADQIRNQDPATAILLVTGDQSIPPTQSLRRGVIAYLVKPVNRDALVKAVNAAVGWTRAERNARPIAERRPGLDDWLNEAD
jgi:DNA-binding NtrC family response regulator